MKIDVIIIQAIDNTAYTATMGEKHQHDNARQQNTLCEDLHRKKAANS